MLSRPMASQSGALNPKDNGKWVGNRHIGREI